MSQIKDNSPEKMPSSPKLDISILALLRNSIRLVGLLTPILVCMQHPDVNLSGKHRSVVVKTPGKDMIREIDVEEIAQKLKISHGAAEDLVRFHANTQRPRRKEETKLEVRLMAEKLAASGMKKSEVARVLVELLPYSDSYSRRLLPDEFKNAAYASLARKRPTKKEGKNGSAELVQRGEETKVGTHVEFDVHNGPENCELNGKGFGTCEGNIKKEKLCGKHSKIIQLLLVNGELKSAVHARLDDLIPAASA